MIIILDTNVLSELMKPSPADAVHRWLVRHGADDLCTTAVCQAEILSGTAILPAGRRRRELETSAEHVFVRAFGDKILPFDSDAAWHFAEIITIRRRIGRRMELADAMIAAIARSREAIVATRNVDDFEACGIDISDPWKDD